MIGQCLCEPLLECPPLEWEDPCGLEKCGLETFGCDTFGGFEEPRDEKFIRGAAARSGDRGDGAGLRNFEAMRWGGALA